MAHNFLSDLKKTLDNCIAELDEIHFMFCKNPESDFTRNRRISFRDYIQLLIQMQSKSVSNEILDFYEHSLSSPSKSAFTQQRYKLQPEGWNFLFYTFVAQCRTLSDNLYCGYRLLACDGSDVNICRAYLKHGGDETETMLLIQRYLTPVRYNRKYPVNLRPKRNRDFMYRAA